MALGWLAPAPLLVGQTPTETKIRLMADALRARDAGELERARKIAEELQVLLPNDPAARRLLEEIDARIAARDEAARNPKPPPMQEVQIPEPTQPRADANRSAGPPTTPASSSANDVPVDLQNEADQLARAEARRIESLVAEVPRQRQRARRLAAASRFDEALDLLDAAIAALPANPATKQAVADLEAERESIATKQPRKPADKSSADTSGTPSARTSERARSGLQHDPPERSDGLAQRIARGRSQYLAGDFEAALITFRAVEQSDPGNQQAREFLARMAGEGMTGKMSREQTRARLLADVTKSWQQPPTMDRPANEIGALEVGAGLRRKLESIVLPSVSFTRTEIGQVVAALGAIAEEFDTGVEPKGVNIVLLDPSHKKPTVTLTLRNTPLNRVLDFVTESIGYQYEVQADAVVVRPGGDNGVLDTRFFPVARATVLRMTNGGAPANVTATRAEPVGGSAAPIPPSAASEGPALRAFLQQAGVNFDAVAGASLAYDGAALIVTQTPRNLARIGNLLERYRDVRQVEIEAKFLEVQEGALEELGVNWTVATKATQRNAGANARYQTSGRALASAFNDATGAQQGRIVRPALPSVFADENENGVYDPGEPVTSSAQIGIDLPIVNNAPRIPGGADLALGAGPLATISGVIGEFDVNAVVRALSQQQGTDLLSAPKVTVLSGNPATITVAQEMRYPQSFGQTQSQVGTGNASGGGSAGVAITAGTPQEFTKRNIGVELRVTPTVEEDDYSISLDLNPKVTEFDGFVEYGGPSIAISGSTTVTVPSGFYQPIFSVRDIATKVTIWDGATLVMGGLTREEVKKVNDKVPILGDLPLIGRAFRSKGESAQKRNLLIFVTANLVNPGGAPKKLRMEQLAATALER